MAYASPDELAAALRVQVTVKNSDLLQQCLNAAASEIDHQLGLTTPLPDTDPDYDLVVRVNVDRGVEHWKASDAAFGGIGFADTGILRVKLDGFERHAVTLTPLLQTFGVA